MQTRLRTLGLAAAAAALTVGAPMAANACNVTPYIGDICLAPYTFCPRGFAAAEGQVLLIANNTSLFSLIGTTYGGDGRTTFALPDLRGRAPLGHGQGPGQPSYDRLGSTGGTAAFTLDAARMPAHAHTVGDLPVEGTAKLHGTSAAADTTSPEGALFAVPRTGIYRTAIGSGTTVSMADTAVTVTGRTGTVTTGPTGTTEPEPVNNMQPFLAMRYCIALEGERPFPD